MLEFGRVCPGGITASAGIHLGSGKVEPLSLDGERFVLTGLTRSVRNLFGQPIDAGTVVSIASIGIGRLVWFWLVCVADAPDEPTAVNC